MGRASGGRASDSGTPRPCAARPVLAGWAAALLVGLGAAQPVQAQSQPTGLAARHRSGQTFLTWVERAELAGERYRIYRHTTAITAATLSQATRIAEVFEGSGRFPADRYHDGTSGEWRPRYLATFVTADGAAPLADGTGLLVQTPAAADLAGAASGTAYYAVTTVAPGGTENISDVGPGNAVGPVAETVAESAPVELAVTGAHGGRVFLQYMDLSDWNPTFNAPHGNNGYYGLDPGEPWVAGALAYAYTYAVGEPDPQSCPAPIPAVLPLVLNLHGWAGNSYGPSTGFSEYYCAYELRPVDVGESWWFGFARDHDYRTGGAPGANDAVANYTERRVLRMIHDLLRHPTLGPRIDPQRVYVYGHSMGGSGALALALRYPDVFAAAYASEPMTDYSTAGDGGGVAWRDELSWKWGPPGLDLPVAIDAPAGWAEHLARFSGTGVWSWQNHRRTLAERRVGEAVPLGLAHGRADDVIEWPTQGKPAYAALDAAGIAWGGAVTDAGHSWQGYAGLPPPLAADGSLVPFAGMSVVRNESVPGLAAVSGEPAIPPPDSGPELVYRGAIEWSSSWDPWDGAPIDTAGEWRVTLRTRDGSSRAADVIPRRLQRLAVAPGARFAFENRRADDDALVASGTVVADVAGAVTVPAFAIGPTGNRLRLVPDGPAPRSWPDSTRGVHVFNDQLAAGMSDAQVRFAATHYAGTQKMTRSEADRLRAVNSAFLILHYRLGLGIGYRGATGDCQPGGDWIRIVEGDDWVVEWPGDDRAAEGWFFHWPEGGGPRVYQCGWGWFLTELDDPGWRTFWRDEVARQLEANDGDGVFMDSLSVPSFLGAGSYRPALPPYDPEFERAWSRRIADWLVWLAAQPLGAFHLVPNVGSWTTSRESTDYSAADGLMVEGFALDGEQGPYPLADWRLQMDRVLAATRRGQATIAQTYVEAEQERMFTVASYLLVKGARSYLNIDLGLDPEWWPEYDLPVGIPLDPVPASIAVLEGEPGLFTRRYEDGVVMVNATSAADGTARTYHVALPAAAYLVEASGGGAVGGDGRPSGTLQTRAVDGIDLGPGRGAVLLRRSLTHAVRRHLPRGR